MPYRVPVLVSYVLLLSKRFKDEFLHEQKTQPKYKANLKKAFIAIAILAAAIATANDIYHLA